MFGYIDEAVVVLKDKVTQAVGGVGLVRRGARTSSSERRHAVQVEVAPLWAAAEVVWDHLRTVAVLICALWRLVGIIFTNLLILLLLFNTSD